MLINIQEMRKTKLSKHIHTQYGKLIDDTACLALNYAGPFYSLFVVKNTSNKATQNIQGSVNIYNDFVFGSKLRAGNNKTFYNKKPLSSFLIGFQLLSIRVQTHEADVSRHATQTLALTFII